MNVYAPVTNDFMVGLDLCQNKYVALHNYALHYDIPS